MTKMTPDTLNEQLIRCQGNQLLLVVIIIGLIVLGILCYDYNYSRPTTTPALTWVPLGNNSVYSKLAPGYLCMREVQSMFSSRILCCAKPALNLSDNIMICDRMEEIPYKGYTLIVRRG